MYVAALALLEIFFFAKCVSPYVTVFLAFVYGLWYFDGKEYTGERRWEEFRNLRIWPYVSPVSYDSETLTELRNVIRGNYVMAMVGCHTLSSAIWGIGLHGGRIDLAFPIHYVVPPLLMWIPIVRDVLLWSGAITYSLRQERFSEENVIRSMLDANRAVAYAPSHFRTRIREYDDDEEDELVLPSETDVGALRERKVNLILVWIKGERERYHIVGETNALMRRVRKWSLERVGYPFPMCYWYRLFHPIKPPLVRLSFGHPITCADYANTTSVQDVMRSSTAIVMGAKKVTKGV